MVFLPGLTPGAQARDDPQRRERPWSEAAKQLPDRAVRIVHS
jgi:hypothetical protein